MDLLRGISLKTCKSVQVSKSDRDPQSWAKKKVREYQTVNEVSKLFQEISTTCRKIETNFEGF